MEFRQGNAYYANESYREALAQFQKGLEIDPAATSAWRSVGLSAMALHRPGVEGEENEKYAQTAVDAFEKYLQAYPEDTKVEEYLTTVLINSARWEEALARLERQAPARAGDPELERAVVTTLMRARRLEEALIRARRPGSKPDPQLLFGIGVACWGQSYGDPTLDPQTRIEVIDQMATTFAEAERLNAEADQWLKKALELRARQSEPQKEAGAGTGTGTVAESS